MLDVALSRWKSTVNEIQRRFLRRLRDAQTQGLQRSSIPKSCDDLIESLQTCGAVEYSRGRSGRGIVLRVAGEQAFHQFVAARLPPGGLDVDVTTIPDRATAVAMLGDAKVIRHSIGQGLFVRSVKPDVEIRSADSEVSISVSQLTAEAGGAGVTLSSEKRWGFVGDIAVVENADAFWQHERVFPDVGLAVFASGNMSARLIEWLASPPMALCRITHWGDYDPVGVCEYVRLADACRGRVVSYAPSEIDELLPKRGKRALITRQTKYLDRLRCRVSDPHVRRMVGLFDAHRKGLEQEVFLRECPWIVEH